MSFILKISFFITASLFVLSESKRGPCNYCDKECLKTKFSDTFKVLRRLDKKKDVDSFSVDEETTINFDLDIAEGFCTMFKSEASNILSARIEELELTQSADKAEIMATGLMMIPELHIVTYGKSKFSTKNSEQLAGLKDLAIPPVIDTKGHLKMMFKDVPIAYQMNLNVTKKSNNKVTLKPSKIKATFKCNNKLKDSDFDYEPDADSGDALKSK